MGALSFNYSVFPDQNMSTKFLEYRWSISPIQYKLKYERYAVLSNASIFNTPVAATKVATGVRLYDLFVDKRERDSAYLKEFQQISYEHNTQHMKRVEDHALLPKEVYLNIKNKFTEKDFHTETIKEWFLQIQEDFHGYVQNNYFVQKDFCLNTVEWKFLRRTIIPNLWDIDTINKYNKNCFNYIQEYLEVYKKDWIDPIFNRTEIVSRDSKINFYENQDHIIPIYPPNWQPYVNEFIMETVPYSRKSMNILPQEIASFPLSYIKTSYSDFLTISNANHPNSMEMYLSYEIRRNELGWNILPNESAVRIKDSNFSILRDNMSIWQYYYRHMNFMDFFIMCRDVWKMKIYDNTFLKKNNVQFSLFSNYSTNRNVDMMNIISPLVQTESENKKLLIDFSFVGVQALNKVLGNISNNFSASKTNKAIDILPNSINVSSFDSVLNIIEQVNIARTKICISIFKNCFPGRTFYSANIFDHVYGSDKNFNIIFDPFINLASLKDKFLDYFQKCIISGKIFNNNVEINNTISGTSSNKNTASDNFISGIQFSETANYTHEINVNKFISNSKSSLSKYENLIVSAFEKNVFVYQGYSLVPYQQTACILSLADFGIKELKYGLVFDDNTFIDSIRKDLNSFCDVWLKMRNKIAIEEANLDIGLEKRHTQTNVLTQKENFDLKSSDMIIYPMISVETNGKKFNIQKSLQLITDRKSLNDLPPIITAKKDRNGISTYINILCYKKKKGLYLSNEKIVRVSDIRKGINIYNHILPIQKERISMIIWPNYDFALKVPYRFTIYDDTLVDKSSYLLNIQDTSESIHKVKYDFIADNNGELINKIKYGFTIHDDNSIYKKRRSIDFIITQWLIYKTPYDADITNYGENAYKKHRNIFLDIEEIIHKKHRDIFLDAEEIVYKKHRDIVLNDIEGVIRNIYPVAVSHYLKYPNWEKLHGFIVPVSKIRPQILINDINDFAKNRYRDIMITEGDFSSVLYRPTTLNFDISLDKLPKDILIDYMNEMLVKTTLKTTIEQGIHAFKKPYNVHMEYEVPWGYLDLKHVFVENNVFSHKSEAKSFLYDDEWMKISPKELMSESDELVFVSKNVKAELFADEWLDKLPLICYYSYDTWGKKKDDKIFEESQASVVRKETKEVFVEGLYGGETSERRAMLEFGDFAYKGIQEAWYEKGVFSERLIKSSAVFKQMDWAYRGVHKCDLPPNDFGNWAWVYETPDPFQYDKYGIDELLLPEKDTQYENFEDLVFDREHMRPRNPLKEISETEWIAKLPIRHPVGKYEDVGKVYEDSAIRWENYFGIQTSVIHDMSLRYYRIWEKNMFKFSTMTMQQAANLMLEYLWSWIPDYYPLDQLEQAYRAFRLIRWYTECAVINNSQYIISYEYADLSWPDAEHKGICHIPSDLQEYDPSNILENSNDTMYSDIEPGHLCLKNNPIYTGSNNVWVTFKIKNRRNTTIKLNMYNESGEVNIYLNNILIDIVYAHGLQKLVYNINYTGGINEFKIEKKAAHNLDNNFIIGHISIANQSFKNLTVNFDPVHRAGNQPLNEVAQKLIYFAALHDRKDIAYNEMLTKNLSISEVYKMLLKYWQLHHENNWKGKRLTIKQV